MSTDSQCRKWQLTLNNPADRGLDHDEIKRHLSQLKSCVYYCLADEIGLETQTPHTHVYIHLKSPARFSRVKKLFPDAHIEQARGSAAENKAYVEKSGKWATDAKADTSIPGTFEEWGELPDEPGQGFRSDLADMYQMIADGMSKPCYWVLSDTFGPDFCEYKSLPCPLCPPVDFLILVSVLVKAPAPPNQAEPGLFLESKPCCRDSSLDRNDCQVPLSGSGNLLCTTPTPSDGGEVYEQNK